jgi:probable H4MPT-linked C1 transfer pathway protein
MHPDRLAAEVFELIRSAPKVDAIALTMSGELADCFDSKAAGVSSIVSAVSAAAGDRPVYVWQSTGRFVDPATARTDWNHTAAANWHLLASWFGHWLGVAEPELAAQPGLLIDMGSTTTDLVPIVKGRPMPHGLTDLERLARGGLVYTGLRRTPLMAVAGSVPTRWGDVPVAAEFFATMLDAALLLGIVEAEENDHETADERSATTRNAHARMARMVCSDVDEIPLADAVTMAATFADAQAELIASRLRLVLSDRPEPVWVAISGSGTPLVERMLLQRQLPIPANVAVVRLRDRLGADAADAACAFAAAAYLPVAAVG